MCFNGIIQWQEIDLIRLKFNYNISITILIEPNSQQYLKRPNDFVNVILRN